MVAPKNTESLNSIPEEEDHVSLSAPKSAKSTESLYSSSSSKYSASALYRRRSQNPVPRCNGFMNGTNNNNNEVRQRVLSARRLRMKTLQNQLADCQQHISELAHENRILRTVHKRQDQALKKYESTNAELPQLLHSHAEEIRIWQSKYKTLQQQNKELTFKMKQKDAQILAFSDQNKYLSQLNKDKNLEDRQKLTDQVQKMEIKLQEKDNEMKLLARKLQLETKSFKIQVQLEHKRYKDAMAKLEKAKNELAVFNKLDELEFNDKLGKNLTTEDKHSARSDFEKEISNAKNAEKNRNSKIPTLKSSDTIHEFCKKNKDMAPGLATKYANQKFQEPHRGQGDGPMMIPNEKSDIDERSKNILMENLESSMKTPEQCPYEDSDLEKNYEPNEEFKYDDDYEDDYSDDGDNLSNSDGQDVILSTDVLTTTKTTEISVIRRKLSEDYKERENFLESFCRQTSSDALKEENGNKKSIDLKRKGKLLAALKAIDSTDD
ncbi:LCA5 family protein [Megaselia abdita]